MQQILIGRDGLNRCQHTLIEEKCEKVFVVCGNSVSKHPLVKEFLGSESEKLIFSDFRPNPDYESIMHGLEVFKENECDCIVAIGGGSAIDVAKCIKAFWVEESSGINKKDNKKREKLLLMAIPTTAGSGSEATKFAVMYRDGEKQSVEREWIRPCYVFLESRLLESLPLNQKKATVLDTLCHSIESYWSVKGDENSRLYASIAIENVLKYYKAYFENDVEACARMHMAAYYAGLAINITRTTAGHALCYKLTTLYGLPHGQAAAVCVNRVWRYTLFLARENKVEKLLKLLEELSFLLKGKSLEDGPEQFEKLLGDMGINVHVQGKQSDIELMVSSVNLERLGNHPVKLSEDMIRKIYIDVLCMYEEFNRKS